MLNFECCLKVRFTAASIEEAKTMLGNITAHSVSSTLYLTEIENIEEAGDIEPANMNVCPCCGSDKITAEEWEPEGAYVNVSCLDCPAKWTEEYVFTGLGNIQPNP